MARKQHTPSREEWKAALAELQRFRKAVHGGAITARAEWSFVLEGQ